MGLLNLFRGRDAAAPPPLPSGSFTVDRTGRLLSTTVPSSFPPDRLAALAQTVLEAFRSAEAAALPFQELTVEYSGLTLRAREMRGGAIIFLSPRKT